MLKKSIRWTASAALLSGAFAAQALWQDEQAPASANIVDELVAGIAICPELAPQMRALLDTQKGVLTHTAASHALVQTRACKTQRQRIGEQHHSRLAYAALQDVLQPQTATDMDNTSVPLQLSLQLGEQ